jgi:hypothetical protein
MRDTRNKVRRALLVFTLVVPTTAVADDFRGSNWGDSVAMVKSQAGEPAMSQDDTLAYEVSISGLDAYLLYNFAANKLVSAGYMFTETHSNDNAFISDYSTISQLLRQKYGAPDEDDSTWLNDLYRDDPSRYGFAISLGHLVKRTLWDTENTTVTHALHGDNYKITHAVLYSSKALASVKEEKDRKKALDQL